ncbi:hypothetical protein NQ314_010399 [Rhamnusium bicolor]|uniref:Sarcosine dehydrogenase n=1 Tax=Rhamnusium bicolor TaxID=1586634 RepID=A0AAV8XRW5_9CUCU|nr:hypothetical protein NQ314_010399 [Rhamnusium bicolor]
MLRMKNSSLVRKKTKNVLSLTNNINKRFNSDVKLPKQADVVVVGGGVIGCSTFYHLCKRGIKAVLLERHKVTSGTTWHSGAIVWSLRGNDLYENTPVLKVLTEPTTNNEKKIIGIDTPKGTIKTNVLVNTCGAWSRDITRMVGLDIPLTAIKHAYVVTGSVPGAKRIPCIRDHDGGLYFRPQGDSILFGGYENNPEIIKELPQDFHFSLYELDKSQFDVHWKNACQLCPSFAKAGIKSDIYGPESFTPDHKPIMGEDPKCVGLFHGSGFNSLGIQLSGGAGEQLASWVALGRPEMPLFAYDIRRFTPVQRQDRAWVTETSHECYVKTYSIAYPYDQRLAGRNHRIDPFHEALIASGAVMEEALGWERPAYFIKDRTAPVRGYDWYGNYGHVNNEDKRYEKELEGDLTFKFSKHHDVIQEEAWAARNNVALFDLSCLTKMYLAGPDAEEAVDWLFTNNLDKEPGSVVYTCSLNSRGGVEADVIVIPLEEGAGTLVGPILKGKGYYIIAGAKSGYQTKSHLRKQLYRKNFKSLVTEMTNRIGILSLQGPKSGELLQSITEFPITDEKIPSGMSKLIKINGHTCRVLRVSYIGELGYELHIPLASCVPVFNRVMEAGRGFELRHAGFRAFESLSCEKGYHLLNYDLRIDDNPVEAGLTRLCRKDGQYLGKQAVEQAKQRGVKKQRVFFTLHDNVALYGYEIIWRNDRIVGYLRRGDYGFSLESSIGTGYIVHPKGEVVDGEFLKSGTYQIEVRNKKYPATLFLKSPFDPNHQRVRGLYEHQFQEQTHFED